MKTFLIVLLFSLPTFAQDMSKTEDYQTVYKQMPDGTSRYMGGCATHEDYESEFVSIKSVVQTYVEPSDLNEKELHSLTDRFDRELLLLVLNMFQVTDLKEDVDDIKAEVITLNSLPSLNLMRFGVGVGGGNGGYVIYNQAKNGKYELMSYTFDGDLLYCDKKVWLQN